MQFLPLAPQPLLECCVVRIILIFLLKIFKFWRADVCASNLKVIFILIIYSDYEQQPKCTAEGF